MAENVLVVGADGRTHALAWSIAQDANVETVYCAPGNGGTNKGKLTNVPFDATNKTNFSMLPTFIESNDISMVVVSPEGPLDAGIVDYLNSEGFHDVWGPTKAATQLESDKFFSYDIMEFAHVPQAESFKCTSTRDAMAAVDYILNDHGVVIKARGLTGGKGVTVCDTKDQALEELVNHADAYGPEVLIAERLVGEEWSAYYLVMNGEVKAIDVSSQDHKRRDNGDKGPNTGGMGAYSPAPVADAERVRTVGEQIVQHVVDEMRMQGINYNGFIYAGMIHTENGDKVIEFNARFGDPECEPTMMMLKNGIYQPLRMALDGKLSEVEIAYKEGAACGVVLAAPGYPATKGLQGEVISGLSTAESFDGVEVFHAGTKKEDDNVLVNGGRVLCVTGYSAKGIEEAQKLAYNSARQIKFGGQEPQYRTDIAARAMGRK